MVLLNSHSSQDDVWNRIAVVAADVERLAVLALLEAVMHFARELKILVKVGQMRRPHVLRHLHVVFVFLHFVAFPLLLQLLLPWDFQVLYLLLGLHHLLDKVLGVALQVVKFLHIKIVEVERAQVDREVAIFGRLQQHLLELVVF